MDKNRKKKLEGAGWKVGSAEEFLGLDKEEIAFVEVKLRLSAELRELRVKRGLSQVELAKRLGSSQSRVAKMEASDPSVSVDLLVKGLLATGASQQQIGKAIAKVPSRRAGKSTTRGNAA
jgi:DNA-binding transcriptional regulator YiaG